MSAQEEEFISFDIIPSFKPEDITRSTFNRLLKCYPLTIREVYRDKLHIKYQGGKKKAKKGEEDLAPEVVVPEKQVEKDLDALLKLDEWRYEVLPSKVREREEKEKDGLFIEKEELVQLMDWKLKHGVFRPTLQGLVKSNQAPLIRKSTAAAYAALPTADSAANDPDAAFPKASLDAVTGLRGVGPATASLILCAGTYLSDTKTQVPFFSDEIYQWLCLDCYPSAEGKGFGDDENDSDNDDADDEEGQKKPPKKGNGKLMIKYSLTEYRNVWNAVFEIRERLNKTAKPDSADEDERRIFSVVDVEKVAYVLANIDLSGYFGEPRRRKKKTTTTTTPPKAPPKKKEEEEKESKTQAETRKRKEKYEKKDERKKRRIGRNN
ncbi:hypothetical protein DTO271G3_7894 [Paecilomyces variotii]|nr:hypothetical protein DTO271G3_7894 [Paecilomyces variotii]